MLYCSFGWFVNSNEFYTLGASHFSFSDDDIPLTVLALRTLGTFDFKGFVTFILLFEVCINLKPYFILVFNFYFAFPNVSIDISSLLFLLDHSLTRFISHCADNFLSSEHKDVRMEAVRTCSCLLNPTLHVSLFWQFFFINASLEGALYCYGKDACFLTILFIHVVGGEVLY